MKKAKASYEEQFGFSDNKSENILQKVKTCKILQNWKRPQNFDIFFCVSFECCCQNLSFREENAQFSEYSKSSIISPLASHEGAYMQNFLY